MIALAIYFKVQQETGSIAVAGLATGLNGLAGALTAGIRGAVIDRFGMIWPLRVLVPSYAALIVVLSLGTGRTELVVLATLLGLTAPPINLSVRPLWKITVPAEKIRTAFALDTADSPCEEPIAEPGPAPDDPETASNVAAASDDVAAWAEFPDAA